MSALSLARAVEGVAICCHAFRMPANPANAGYADARGDLPATQTPLPGSA